MKLGYKGCNGRYRHDNACYAGLFVSDVIHYGVPLVAGALIGCKILEVIIAVLG